jgi:hypothetical protein
MGKLPPTATILAVREVGDVLCCAPLRCALCATVSSSGTPSLLTMGLLAWDSIGTALPSPAAAVGMQRACGWLLLLWQVLLKSGDIYNVQQNNLEQFMDDARIDVGAHVNPG